MPGEAADPGPAGDIRDDARNPADNDLFFDHAGEHPVEDAFVTELLTRPEFALGRGTARRAEVQVPQGLRSIEARETFGSVPVEPVDTTTALRAARARLYGMADLAETGALLESTRDTSRCWSSSDQLRELVTRHIRRIRTEQA